jgi:NAD+ synthase (glutamine-hydrolysing)
VQKPVGHYNAETQPNGDLRRILLDVAATPISPELLPPDSSLGSPQSTEEAIGPYELHDFFIYHILRSGSSPSKVVFLAADAFRGIYSSEEICYWLKVFYERFFSQQFKRSSMPDGPKVGSVALSPRGDWRMPSDGEVTIWSEELRLLSASTT